MYNVFNIRCLETKAENSQWAKKNYSKVILDFYKKKEKRKRPNAEISSYFFTSWSFELSDTRSGKTLDTDTQIILSDRFIDDYNVRNTQRIKLKCTRPLRGYNTVTLGVLKRTHVLLAYKTSLVLVYRFCGRTNQVPTYMYIHNWS